MGDNSNVKKTPVTIFSIDPDWNSTIFVNTFLRNRENFRKLRQLNEVFKLGNTRITNFENELKQLKTCDKFM